MNRTAPLVALVVSLALAGCGEKKDAPDTAAPKQADAAKPADVAKKPADTAKQAADAAKKDAENARAAAAAAAKSAKIAATQKALAPQVGDIPFTADWQAAMAQAKTSKKPLMFLFTDKDNADGAKMGAGAFKDPKIVAAAAAFIPAIVDADANAPLAEQFGARTTPMIVYASPTGEVLGSTIAADDILSDIKAALDAQRLADAASK
jgi:hypothetical protein